MIREVGNDHPVRPGNIGVGQEMAPLLAVGPGGVLAHEWDPVAAFLEVDAVLGSLDVDIDVLAGSRLEFRHGRGPSRFSFVPGCFQVPSSRRSSE